VCGGSVSLFEEETVFSLIDEREIREDLDQHLRSANFGVMLGKKSLVCEPPKIMLSEKRP
jgi:ERCC4-type nuclease